MIKQEQNILHKQNDQKPEKALSENGSTNQSDGTLEDLDEDFSIEQKKDFEFINESVENWPQWTVKDPEDRKDQDQQITAIKQIELNSVQLQQLDDIYLYNRGVMDPIGIVRFEGVEKKESKFSRALKKVKNVPSVMKKWFS